MDTSSIFPDSGGTVIPELFIIACGDSQEITFSLTPSSFETRELVNKHQNAGHHIVEWNASSVPSGLYFYQLTSGRFSKTMKMILIK